MNYFLNLDFIYYLIYLFFRSIANFLASVFGVNSEFPNKNNEINIIDLINYLTHSNYNISGNGFGSWYDGYSLFTPPHGLNSWGNGFFDSLQHWLENFFTNPYCPECPSFFDLIFGGINSIFWLLSFLILILFLFLKEKENRLKELDWEKYDQVFEKETAGGENKKSKRWETILNLLESPNKNDWRMAILDADKLLDEVLIEQGFTGTSLGERLKSASFDSLQNAWEAHKIRNLIAHDPNHELTKQEAKRAIQNYSLVFNEFYYL